MLPGLHQNELKTKKGWQASSLLQNCLKYFIKTRVFWDIMPRWLVNTDRHFEVSQCLWFSGLSCWQESLLGLLNPEEEELGVFRNVGNIYQSTRSNNPEDVNRHEYRCDHIKPRRTLISLTRWILQCSPQRPTLWFITIKKIKLFFCQLTVYRAAGVQSTEWRKSIRKAVWVAQWERKNSLRLNFVNSVPNTEVYKIFSCKFYIHVTVHRNRFLFK